MLWKGAGSNETAPRGLCYGQATPFLHKAPWAKVKYVGCISIESLTTQNCINIQALLTPRQHRILFPNACLQKRTIFIPFSCFKNPTNAEL